MRLLNAITYEFQEFRQRSSRPPYAILSHRWLTSEITFTTLRASELQGKDVRNPEEKQNIVVIGGGIIGCTTAYYLTHYPQFKPSVHTVTLIEAAKLANGASGKAGGLLAAWANPSNLARLSFDLHDQLARDYNGAELWGYRRVRYGQLTAIVSQRKDTSKLESSSHPNIDLGK